MRWKNVLKDGVPKDKEEVLISINGVNYLALFYSMEKEFYVREIKKTFLINDGQIIYWQELTNPPTSP
jgi:hypothetical protein